MSVSKRFLFSSTRQKKNTMLGHWSAVCWLERLIRDGP